MVAKLHRKYYLTKIRVLFWDIERLAISTDAEGKSTNQIEKYEIETLWVRLGNHATSQGVVMQMDVIKGNSSTQDMYNLKFTATGSYISITDFISAIEKCVFIILCTPNEIIIIICLNS